MRPSRAKLANRVRDDPGLYQSHSGGKDDLFGVPRGCSRLRSSAAGLQQIGPRQQRQNHPVGKDKNVGNDKTHPA
jgi:hypothetical protein